MFRQMIAHSVRQQRMRHVDLFSGVGGFSLAAQWVWGEAHEIVLFCEQDKFCQKVLRKHWPTVPIVEDVNDIEQIVAYANSRGLERSETQRSVGNYALRENIGIDLLTGGVPCQPSSCAGKRKGTEDDRWLWPQALEVVDRLQPRWVIFENPTGFLSLNKGVEYESVLAHLEAQGYWTESFVIPASAVGAPHRRDRVWIIAHAKEFGTRREPGTLCGTERRQDDELLSGSSNTDSDAPHPNREMRDGLQHQPEREAQGGVAAGGTDCHAADTCTQRWNRTQPDMGMRSGITAQRNHGTGETTQRGNIEGRQWEEDWFSALTRIHAFHDGLPGRLVVSAQPKGWRVNALKAVGNSVVVPLVAEIFKAIKAVDDVP